MSRRPGLPAAFAVLGLALLAAGCSAPTRPVSSLPEQVIQNDPAARAAQRIPTPLPLPIETAPLHDELPPTPIVFPDVLERIRAGYQLPDVDNRSIDVQLDWYVRNADYLNRVMERAQRYLHYIANEVERRGLPMELALLPVVESAFNPFAYSRSHASGLWQFIPSTGKRFELRQDWWQDQRRDVLLSTNAALDYLTLLNDMFGGDWMLAVAAYNVGNGSLRRSIARAEALGRDTDFFSLSLPSETRAYVPKLMALARLVRNPAAYGVTLPYIPDASYFEVVETGGPVDLRLAAELAGIDVEELHALNPGWSQWVTAPDGPHRLLIPAVVVDSFQERFAALDPPARARLAAYEVAKGDTLDAIAGRYRVPVTFLSRVNELDGSGLKAGATLLVPGGEVSPLRSGLVRSATTVHRVKSGESLWSISRRYGMSVGELARANGINQNSVLRPGQRLNVRPPGGSVASAPGPATREISYQVKRGDTLSGIARRFSVSVRQLQAWNDMGTRTWLRTGQRLTVRVNASRDFGG